MGLTLLRSCAISYCNVVHPHRMLRRLLLYFPSIPVGEICTLRSSCT